MVPFKVDDWQKAAAERRAQIVYPDEWKLDQAIIDSLTPTSCVLDIPKNCGILAAKEIQITEIDASVLLDRLSLGEYTSCEVTLAFCKRAAIAHQLTNCLTDLFHEEALEYAKDLDEKFKKSGPVGRLHGLPVSFKDMFNIKGRETNLGYVSWIGNIKEKDGEAVTCIKTAGGIPFCKTHCAQGCMIVEGVNNIFGLCSNPCNLSLSTAGSSSGEAALVKMRGSPLGMATDAGGSIRLPAHSTGTYGFMPSSNRVTYLGIGEGRPGLTWIQPQMGPIVNDVNMVEIWIKAMLDCKMYDFDPQTYNVGWKEVGEPKFGVIYNDNVVDTTPAMLRTLRETVNKLQGSGYEVVEINIGDLHRKITETVLLMYVSGGCELYRSSIEASGEPCIPRCCGSECKKAMTMNEIHALDAKAREYSEEYLKLFVDNKIDVLLTPSCPNPAAPHGKYSTNSISAVYNLLGYVAGIVPTGTIDLDIDKPASEYSNSKVLEDPAILDIFPYDYFDKYVKTELYTDVEKFKNAPLSVQVVGKRLGEEYVIKAMDIIAKL